MRLSTFVLDDRPASIAGWICLVGLGVFLVWAALVPIAEGVSASGHVVAADNRKVVQHLEGGIVKKLLVKEGSIVKAGDVLLELDDVRASAERVQAAQAVGALRAATDRLTALSSNAPSVVFSPTDDLALDPVRLAAVQAQERRVFDQQRDAYFADRSVLGARRTSLTTNAGAKEGQIAAVNRSLALVRENLARRRDMLSRQLIRRDSVEQLEQEEASLVAELARLAAERGDAWGQAGEVSEQIGKSRADFLAQVSADLLRSRTDLQAAEEALRAADDVLRRTVVRAPQGGKVLNLAFTTIGGVLRPGDAIMEIVPDSRTLIAQVQVRPNSRDAVYEGLPVRAQLSVNKSWNAPPMEGKVLDVSGDLKSTPETGLSYYEARVELTATPELLSRFDIVPGMPVEAFVESGARRTFLSYLVEPVSDIIRRGLQ